MLTLKLNAIKIVQIWNVIKCDISFLVTFLGLFKLNLATKHGVLCQGPVAQRSKHPLTRL
jgi:hypothetical protein